MCVLVLYFFAVVVFTLISFRKSLCLLYVYSTQQELKFLFIAAATERMSD